MSREAFERTVERVAKDPTMRKAGMDEQKARELVAPIAIEADSKPRGSDYYPSADTERGIPKPRIRQTRVPAEDAPAAAPLIRSIEKASGMAPPRVSLAGRSSAKDRKIAGAAFRRHINGIREMLERSGDG